MVRPLRFFTQMAAGKLSQCVAGIFATCLWGCLPGPAAEAGGEAFDLADGLAMQLIAKEPLVIDPVAFAFDGYGHLYVVEHRGYPDPAEGGKPAKKEGRIARLTDTDGDGIYDKRTEFAKGLTYPNGVLPWKGGIFVTCAPDIYYMKDTDGDGIADVRQVVLTGFYDTKTAQIRMSHPVLGLDGWIYVTGGLNGGKITSPIHPERDAVTYQSGDGRFHPETFEFEVTGGKSQFGLTFDAYGRRFGCSNRHPVQHVVMEPRYLNRNPALLFSETVQNVSKAEAEAKVYPVSGAATTADFIPNLIGRSHQGTFTSASGVYIFKDETLGPAHKGNVFICESAQNLVQCQAMKPEGVSFRSDRVYEGREFLASRDEWFRPVFLGTGPGGGLYVADMCRKIIDHPSYVPEHIRGEMDFKSGKDKGRLYRIYLQDGQPAGNAHFPESRTFSESRSSSESRTFSKSQPFSESQPSPEIVRYLQSDLEWERETAFRLLLERKDSRVAEALKTIDTTGSKPESRVKALCLLELTGKMDQKTLQAAFADEEPGIREQAVLLAGKHEMKALVIGAADDTNMRVRFTAGLVLGSMKGTDVVKALARIAARDGEDPWSRAAVLSGIGTQLPEFLQAFRSLAAEKDTYALVMRETGRLMGTRGSLEACNALLREVAGQRSLEEWQLATVLGLMEGLSGREETRSGREEIAGGRLGARETPLGNAYQSEWFAAFIRRVEEKAVDTSASVSFRKNALSMLGYTAIPGRYGIMEEMLSADQPPVLQLEAVSSLTRMGDPEAAKILTRKESWTGYTPRLRSAVLSSLVSRDDYIDVLFQAIEEGIIKASALASADRQRLMSHADERLRGRAKELFRELEDGNRMQVYEQYRSLLDEEGKSKLGKAVFQRTCSSCHTYAGQGGQVGPDLTGVKNQPADALLLHTLVPNYEVYPAYQAIAVQTTNGAIITGWVVSETENSLTLRTGFGTDEPILRSAIKTITASGRSLMPDGLEQTMTKEDLKNLIAYLKSGG